MLESRGTGVADVLFNNTYKPFTCFHWFNVLLWERRREGLTSAYLGSDSSRKRSQHDTAAVVSVVVKLVRERTSEIKAKEPQRIRTNVILAKIKGEPLFLQTLSKVKMKIQS